MKNYYDFDDKGNCHPAISAIAALEEAEATITTVFDWSVAEKLNSITISAHRIQSQIGSLKDEITKEVLEREV
jgi:hypothetical protein